jgi:hypothetical protein
MIPNLQVFFSLCKHGTAEGVCGVRPKGKNFGVEIKKDKTNHWLGIWDSPEEVARTYDWMTIQKLRKKCEA